MLEVRNERKARARTTTKCSSSDPRNPRPFRLVDIFEECDLQLLGVAHVDSNCSIGDAIPLAESFAESVRDRYFQGKDLLVLIVAENQITVDIVWADPAEHCKDEMCIILKDDM